MSNNSARAPTLYPPSYNYEVTFSLISFCGEWKQTGLFGVRPPKPVFRLIVWIA